MGGYKSFAHTVTGISHTKHGKGCEDACFHKDETGVSLAVVADGHGDDNCFRSAQGALLAVASAGNGIQDFVKHLNEPEEAKLFRKSEPRKKLLSKKELETCLRKMLIEKGIIPAWFKTVAGHFDTNHFTEEELKKASDKYRKRYSEGEKLHHAYGTTLIAAAITPEYWFGIHIGDGRLTALYPDGSFSQPVPWDDKCNLNVTTSICDDDSAERARCYFSLIDDDNPPPVAVFICTDGIDDNYPVEENEKYLFKLYRTISLCFAEDGFESACSQLKDLINQFAVKGKGDDTSIGLLIDMEALKQAVPVWKEQIAREEAAAEKAPEAEGPKPDVARNAQEAVSAYGKQMKSLESYGTFTGINPQTGEIEQK